MLFRTKIYQGTLGSAGFTSHYSHNSMYIALGAIAWFAFAVNSKKKSHIILCLLAIVAMLFTQKRGPLIALVIAILLTAVLREKGSLSKRFTKYVIAGVIILVGVYIAYLLFPVLFAVFDRFSNSDDLLSNRGYLWEYAWDLFKSSPIWGHGWGYYANSIDININSADVSNINAHNIYLQLLADTGIIGTLIFLVPMIFTLFVSIKLIKRNKNDGIAPELAFSLCFQIFFLIYGFSGNPLYDRQMFIPYMISVAITMYHAVSVKNSKYKKSYVKATRLSTAGNH
ncbi:MAG: O-antigen ligase family protein [Ruminococcus sp.]